MAIYSKTKLSHFIECLDSINGQSLLPSEVIIVQDGYLPFSLKDVTKRYSSFESKLFYNSDNYGLPYSLNLGLSYCSNEIVFRMDSDDICHKDRFLVQFNEISNDDRLVVLGSNVDLVDENSFPLSHKRAIPLNDEDIRKMILIKNPFNHPTVVFRKSYVLALGGYTDLFLYEDWFMWIKLSKLEGLKFKNLNSSLVKYRIRSLYERRGLKTIQAEWKFYKLLYDDKVTTLGTFLFLVSIKSFIRMLPSFIFIFFKKVYDLKKSL